MVWHLTALPQVQMEGFRLKGLSVLVLGDRNGPCQSVVTELERQGGLVRLAHDSAEMGTGDDVPDAIVDLTMLDHESWRTAFLRSVTALRTCYDQWSAEASAGRLFYLAVTYLGGGMGYHVADEVDQPLGGVWAGLAKSLHREIPNCNARVVDVGRAEMPRLPSIIGAELRRRGPVEVGHRDGQRWTLTPRVERAGRPRVRLGTDDVVLVSGGGRGIGWLLARTLARDSGARVVITGRDPFPATTEPWLGMGEAELTEYERSLWSTLREGRTPAQIRRQINGIRKMWELTSNIATAQRDRLAIDYMCCDITERDQVRALLAELGDRVTAVVHNAGIDNASRLPKKSDEEMIRTVETKTVGFRNLFEEVRHRDLKFFCNVGSLTGRLGGMVGQLEYAAANDGLARLGLWARRLATFPVMTLCWPTWNRVGLIANFRASLRYMPALDIEEGLRAWQEELLAGSEGEVTFVGPLGPALDPGQVIGYPLVPQLPRYGTSFPKVFHLGEVLEYRPARSMRAVVTMRRDQAPAIGDFLVSGAPALPVGLLLENAVRAAEWMLPEDFAEGTLSHIDDIDVPLSVLAVDGAAAVLDRVTSGSYQDDHWHVEVCYRRSGDNTGPAARLRVVYAAPGGESAVPRGRQGPTVQTQGSGVPTMHWRGMVIPLESWRQQQDGRVTAETRPDADNDLWVMPYPPRTALPVVAVENVLRQAIRPEPTESIGIARLSVFGATKGACQVAGEPAMGMWRINDARSGRPVATIDGLAGRPTKAKY
jgi:NAD(P)-dependent dehydrogenase (short-subunit alcohol dehydrogenase family)